jgi:hypothetical protein
VCACVTVALVVSCGSVHRRLPPPVAPTHVATWAYVDACDGVGPAQVALVRTWVTYAEAKCANDHELAPDACHEGTKTYCTSVAYIDPNLAWTNAGQGFPIPRCVRAAHGACANEAWYVHGSTATGGVARLRWTAPEFGVANLLNGSDPSLDSFVSAYAHRALSHFNGLMVDDVDASTQEQLFGSGIPKYLTSDELHSNAAVQADHVTLADALQPFVQIDNGLSVNPFTLPAFVLLNRPSDVVGLVAEGYPESGKTNSLDHWYSTGLDDLAYLETDRALDRDFVALLGYNPSGSMVARLVQEATLMLVFEPGRVVDWEDLQQDGPGLAVWPEEQLYFERPLETMRKPYGWACMDALGGPCFHGHADLQVAHGYNVDEQHRGAGVYRREFARCFLRGYAIGGCAALVNDTDRTVTAQQRWLKRSYRYTMTLVGGELEYGGWLVVHGPKFTPGVTTIGPDSALLLSR